MDTPCYLTWFRLEGHRCFGPRQTLTLTHPDGSPAMWTLLLGRNGVGKTTLLELIASKYDATTRRSTSQTHPATTKADAGLTSQGLPTIHAYGASRRVGRSLAVEDLDGGMSHLLGEDVLLLGAEQWYLRAHMAASASTHDAPEARARLERIRSLLTTRLFPHVEELRITGLGRAIPRPRVEGRLGGRWAPLNELTRGQHAPGAWVVDLAARMFERAPEHDDPLGQPSVVLVDGIDQGLHPGMQRELATSLRELFPNTQFIVTAHSPLVVQSAHDANIALLERDGDHVTLTNGHGHMSRWRLEHLYTSLLFDLPSTAPPAYDAFVLEREELLGKADLTSADRARIEELDAVLDELPMGRSPEENEAMRLVMRAAAQLGGHTW